MTDRRLPHKIIAKKKQARVVLWGTVLAFVSTVLGFFLVYFIEDKPYTSNTIAVAKVTEAWDDPVYDLESTEEIKEDVIADQAVEESELVRIFKRQENSSEGISKTESPTWLKNSVAWPYKLNQPMVALVINDAGKLKRDHWQFIKKLDIPLTYTISVDDKNYQKLASLANKKGREVISHIPMEPLFPSKLPKALKGKKWMAVHSNKQKIEQHVEELIKKTPYVIGFGNQMGSAFTSNKQAMKRLLEILKEKGYIFLDSMTTKESKALEVARELKAPYLRRQLSFSFKDRNIDIKSVANRILKNNKYLVLFVNPDKKALQETMLWVQEKQDEGVVFVPLTAIMRRSIVQQKLPLSIDKKSKVFLRPPGLV
jgi:polysaccharide deacetylase 2 family uncharacterized protein YibQ